MREWTRSRPRGWMVRRRASQASRSAVSGLIGPAPSSSGGACSLRCTIRVVGLRLGPATPPPPRRARARAPAPPAPAPGAACLSAGERDEGVGGGVLPLERAAAALLVERALVLGDAADGLLEDEALLERQAAAECQLAPCPRPGHAQRAPLIQLGIISHAGRGERTRRQRDQTRRPAHGETRQLPIALGRRILGGGCDLVECQHARAERLLECRQAAQRLARARQPHSRAVIATRDLRQPLRSRRAPRRPPITLIIGLAHDLARLLLQPSLLLCDLPKPPRRPSRRRSSA